MEKLHQNKLDKKILVFTEMVYPGKEKTDLNLVFELKKFFSKVNYAVMPLSLFKKGIAGFPGIDDKYKLDKSFKEVKTIWLKSKKEIYKLIIKYDIIVFGNNRNVSDLIYYSRIRKKITVVHNNPSNFDNILNLTSNLYCLDNKLNYDQLKSNISKKKILKVNNSDKFIITGSPQYNPIFQKHIKKKNFFRKYKLDMKKNFVLFMPSSPALLRPEVQEIYKEVVIFLKKKFNVLIKNHPSDYFKRKVNFYDKNKLSHEAILSDKKLFLNPKDFESALFHCKYVFSFETTGFVPVNMSKKPIVYIDRFKFMIEDLKSNQIPNSFYSNVIKIRNYKPSINKLNYLKKIKNTTTINHLCNSWASSNPYYFYGCDISFKGLKKLNFKFKTKKFDNSLFDLNSFQKDYKSEKRIAEQIALLAKNSNLKISWFSLDTVNLIIYRFLKIIMIFNKIFKIK